jgi:hypothetical protein
LEYASFVREDISGDKKIRLWRALRLGDSRAVNIVAF